MAKKKPQQKPTQKPEKPKPKAEPVVEPAKVPVVEPEPEKVPAEPEPEPEKPVEPEKVAKVAAGAVRLQLVDEAGAALGVVDIVAAERRPTFTRPMGSGELEQFVAAHALSDGAWVYRRVGVERA